MRIAIVGNFGLSYKATMSHRALPIAAELARRGNQVAVFVPDEDPGREALSTSPGVSIQHVVAPRQREGGRGRLLALIGHLAVGLRLVRRALAFRPEVIYAFKPKG